MVSSFRLTTERKSALAARLRQEGLTVEVINLPVGDIRISDRILIERKTSRDFVDSLLDGRLLDQATRLVGAAPRAMLILEGSDLFQHRAVSGQAIMGALATLTLDYGLPVVTSSDTAETARFVAVSARREASMLEHLSAQAQARMRASEHPDLFNDAEEKGHRSGQCHLGKPIWKIHTSFGCNSRRTGGKQTKAESWNHTIDAGASTRCRPRIGLKNP